MVHSLCNIIPLILGSRWPLFSSASHADSTSFRSSTVCMSASLCMCASTCAFVFCFENTNSALADTNKLTHTAVLSESWHWMLRQWSLITSPKMHSVPVLMLEQGQRLDHYLNHQLPGLSPLWHTPPPAPSSQNVTIGGLTHTQHMTVDEKCRCWFPCLPEFQTLTQNRKNPEMILPVIPCSPHANWRLLQEKDHRQTPLLKAEAVTAQCSQEAIFEKEVRDGFIPSYI